MVTGFGPAGGGEVGPDSLGSLARLGLLRIGGRQVARAAATGGEAVALGVDVHQDAGAVEDVGIGTRLARPAFDAVAVQSQQLRLDGVEREVDPRGLGAEHIGGNGHVDEVVGVEEARDGDLKAIAGVDLGGPQLDYGAGIDEVFQPAGDALLTLAELPLLGSVRGVGSYFFNHRSASWMKIKRPSQTGSRKESGWANCWGRLVFWGVAVIATLLSNSS